MSFQCSICDKHAYGEDFDMSGGGNFRNDHVYTASSSTSAEVNNGAVGNMEAANYLHDNGLMLVLTICVFPDK